MLNWNLTEVKKSFPHLYLQIYLYFYQLNVQKSPSSKKLSKVSQQQQQQAPKLITKNQENNT